MSRTALRRLMVLLLCAMAGRVWADDREFTRAGMATADGFRLEEFLGAPGGMRSCECPWSTRRSARPGLDTR